MNARKSKETEKREVGEGKKKIKREKIKRMNIRTEDM
jgi:hypothetical protein